MTTWEPATPADIEELRLLLQALDREGIDIGPDLVTHDQLARITKKEAGALRTRLRELTDEGRPHA